MIGVARNASAGVDANPALDPVVSDLENPAYRWFDRWRRELAVRVGYGLDEGERVGGVGIAAARDLPSEVGAVAARRP